MSDNVAIYLSPAGGVDDLYFTAGVTAVEEVKSGAVDLADELPPMWKGKYQGHFFAFDHTLPASLRLIELGITHLALLEGPMGGTGHFYFAGDAIAHNGVVLYFNAGTQRYYYLHDRDNAVTILKWITEQQEKWSSSPRPAALAA